MEYFFADKTEQLIRGRYAVQNDVGLGRSGVAAAGGIALINSVANIGGFFGASILGQLGLWSMAAVLMFGGLLAASVLRNWSPKRTRSNAHDICASALPSVLIQVRGDSTDSKAGAQMEEAREWDEEK